MTSARPRLLHVATTDMTLELLLGPQLEAFAGAGYEVLATAAPSGYAPALEARGVRFLPLEHATRAMDPRSDARAVVELTRLLRRERPHIVHTHNPKPGWYGRPAARLLARVPVVVNTVHGLYAQPDDPPARRAVVYALERVAAACSQHELVQNPEDVATLRRLAVPETRLTVLGNGIDLTRFDPHRFTPDERASARRELVGDAEPDDLDDVVVVGVVGRLVREKGYAEVFEAARRLRGLAPQVRVAVIGPDEPDKADSLTAADRATAHEAGVRFLGGRDDVDRLYAGMDLFVLASHREGFPRSAMEAAAMGLPVLATDIRGCRQVVDHGGNGLLVPRGDAAALAAAVARLANDPAERTAMAAAAIRKAAREFDQATCIATTLCVYERLLAGAGLAVPAPVA